MRALLVAEGLRVSWRRVREMLVRVNPAAAARRWSSTVARRVYHVTWPLPTVSRHVASPNSLWHIDGNMRLIRLVKLQVVEILSMQHRNSVTVQTSISQFLQVNGNYSQMCMHI